MFIVASVGGEACRLAGGGFGGGLRGAEIRKIHECGGDGPA